MTTTEDLVAQGIFPALPEVWQDEDGYAYWADGHIEPYRFLLACVVDEALNVGYDGVIDFLYLLDNTDVVGQVTERAGAVEWRWARPSPEDAEHMDFCAGSDDEAVPITRLSL